MVMTATVTRGAFQYVITTDKSSQLPPHFAPIKILRHPSTIGLTSHLRSAHP